MNSNLAVYMGAYVDIIHSLALLDSTANSSISYIVPYLNQMHIAYKVYTDENVIINDTDSFQPNAILTTSDTLDMYKSLEGIINKLGIDAVGVNPPKNLFSKFLQDDWYFVTIYNPRLTQTTHICHTNAKKNVPFLTMLNNYQNIKVEWQ